MAETSDSLSPELEMTELLEDEASSLAEDADGEEIISASHIGNQNPIRYRGYYYEAETGFYYLGSRYYDPDAEINIYRRNL